MLREQASPVDQVMLTGGAAQSPAVRTIAAAVFGVPVLATDPYESVAVGAAPRQAAWALTGTLPDWSAPISGTYEPQPGESQAAVELDGRYRAALRRGLRTVLNRWERRVRPWWRSRTYGECGDPETGRMSATMSTPVPPLDWPHYGIGSVAAVKRVLLNYATFTGRASRSELLVVDPRQRHRRQRPLRVDRRAGSRRPDPDGEPGRALIAPTILLVVWALAVIIPSIAVTVRRLHDAGHSGWFYLFSVFGLGIVTLVLCAMETSPAAAKYGPPYPHFWLS